MYPFFGADPKQHIQKKRKCHLLFLCPQTKAGIRCRLRHGKQKFRLLVRQLHKQNLRVAKSKRKILPLS